MPPRLQVEMEMASIPDWQTIQVHVASRFSPAPLELLLFSRKVTIVSATLGWRISSLVPTGFREHGLRGGDARPYAPAAIPDTSSCPLDNPVKRFFKTPVQKALLIAQQR